MNKESPYLIAVMIHVKIDVDQTEGYRISFESERSVSTDRRTSFRLGLHVLHDYKERRHDHP